eukprot:TRINITY_DN4986_c0_g1_i1.p1 TRINITY_DN4986_c0_g1~~TRINITY_DN4986_c0_g1_i1.p1  ORF type:complete len:428 (-),score=88.80 TRINITY_DN4986_c0_g1_i1:84-1367(-)
MPQGLLAESRDHKPSKTLLFDWVVQNIGHYEGVVTSVSDQSFGLVECFQSGLAFLAMADVYCLEYLGDHKFDYSQRVNEYSLEQNLEYIFELGQELIGLPRLLHVENFPENINEENLYLYISMYHYAFKSGDDQRLEREDIIGQKLKDIGTPSNDLRVIKLNSILEKQSEEVDSLERSYKLMKEEYEAFKKQYKEDMNQKSKQLQDAQEHNEELKQSLNNWESKHNNTKQKISKYEEAYNSILSTMTKNIIEHLENMYQWKDTINNEINYKSPKVVQRTVEDLSSCNPETQITYLCESLEVENTLLKEYFERYEKNMNAIIEISTEESSVISLEDSTSSLPGDDRRLSASLEIPLITKVRSKSTAGRPHTSREKISKKPTHRNLRLDTLPEVGSKHRVSSASKSNRSARKKKKKSKRRGSVTNSAEN